MATAAAAAKPTKKGALRKDPRSLRPVDGTMPWAQLLNQDPKKKYILANKADEMQGVSYYEAIGYDIEHAKDPRVEKNCLRFAAGKTARVGEPLESFGHVCMSISLDRWEEIQREGIFGGGGQAYADRIEKHLIRKRGGVDPLRGLGVNNFVSIEYDARYPGIGRAEAEQAAAAQEDEGEGDESLAPNEDPFADP